MAAWCGCAALGMRSMLDYEFTAAKASDSPSKWPTTSALVRSEDRPTLVMFLHPRCPCSRASLTELSQLATSSDGRLSIQIVFVLPSNVAEGWKQASLWKWAQEIPGAVVTTDQNGTEAQRFGVATSGESLLFDTDGQLMFQGGMTAARGHEGNNAGRIALTSLVASGHAEWSRSPVFGCPLLNRCCQLPEAEVPCNP